MSELSRLLNGYQPASRLTRHGTPGRLGPNRTHGIRSTYVDGCRCDPCRDAEALYNRGRKRERHTA